MIVLGAAARLSVGISSLVPLAKVGIKRGSVYWQLWYEDGLLHKVESKAENNALVPDDLPHLPESLTVLLPDMVPKMQELPRVMKGTCP